MIKAEDAIAEARKLLGTPYAQMDCIALIRLVIRSAPGGERDYRCAGTNWLWNSVKNSGKYRHITWRQEGTSGARGGMLAFKRAGDDVHHVGLVTGENTVIHASSGYGRAVETPLDAQWTLLAEHRLIAPMEAAYAAQEESAARSGVVRTEGGRLNVRSAPGGRVIGRIENGARVKIDGEERWLRIALEGGGFGYVAQRYVQE